MVLVGWFTLRPDPAAAAAAAASPWWCIACGPGGGADLLLNAVMFLPLGWWLAREDRQPGTALLLGALLATAIELLQGTVIAGRDAALGDVLANGGGALLGNILAGPVVRDALTRHRDRLAAFSLLLFVLMLVASARLMRPWLADSGPLALVAPPHFVGRPTYHGATDTLVVRLGPAKGDDGFLARFAWAPPDTAALTPILRLEDRRGFPVAAIDRRGQRLGVELRLAGARWRLRTPSWTVTIPASVSAGEKLLVQARGSSGTIRISVDGEAARAQRVVRLGVTTGWALLNPFAPADDDATWRWWTLGWLAGWGALLGFAAGVQRRRLAWGLAAVGILMAIAAATGALATKGEVVALAAGWLVGVSSRRLRRPADGA